jgi:hypothetical protein
VRISALCRQKQKRCGHQKRQRQRKSGAVTGLLGLDGRRYALDGRN